MKVIIDADACPVKDIVIKETTSKNIEVILVSSLSHFSRKELKAHVTAIYVDMQQIIRLYNWLKQVTWL